MTRDRVFDSAADDDELSVAEYFLCARRSLYTLHSRLTALLANGIDRQVFDLPRRSIALSDGIIESKMNIVAMHELSRDSNAVTHPFKVLSELSFWDYITPSTPQGHPIL